VAGGVPDVVLNQGYGGDQGGVPGGAGGGGQGPDARGGAGASGTSHLALGYEVGKHSWT
jgi:hypothetical protein